MREKNVKSFLQGNCLIDGSLFLWNDFFKILKIFLLKFVIMFVDKDEVKNG